MYDALKLNDAGWTLCLADSWVDSQPRLIRRLWDWRNSSLESRQSAQRVPFNGSEQVRQFACHRDGESARAHEMLSLRPRVGSGCGSKPMVPFWGRCTTHVSLVYFSRDWDVRWGYGILTHGQVGNWPLRLGRPQGSFWLQWKHANTRGVFSTTVFCRGITEAHMTSQKKHPWKPATWGLCITKSLEHKLLNQNQVEL